MDAHRTAAQMEGLTGGILMAAMIGAERGAARYAARQRQAQDIIAHNAQIARIRARRRKAAAAVAQQVAIGQSRMSRWIDRATH